MTTFIITEDNKFLTTNAGVFLIVDKDGELVSLNEVRRAYTVLPRITEFKILPRTTEFKVIRNGVNMLEISPRENLDEMVVGEDYAFALSLKSELGTKTVDSYTYKVYDSSDVEVTDTFGGGNTINDDKNIITFGIKAISAGTYTLKFVVTCNDVLPDGTPYEFNATLTVVIA